MKCMNVMQCNSQRQKRKTQKPKNKEQWSQRKSNEAQGPCQIGKQVKSKHPSIREVQTSKPLELLHIDLMGPAKVFFIFYFVQR